MTDRELLELAAKAAGVQGHYRDGSFNGIVEPVIGGGDVPWNPLRNDGQALRLAVRCGIAVAPYPIYEWPKHSVIAARKSLEESRTEVVEPYNSDIYAATRRAIVRAAAEIGKGMK